MSAGLGQVVMDLVMFSNFRAFRRYSQGMFYKQLESLVQQMGVGDLDVEVTPWLIRSPGGHGREHSAQESRVRSPEDKGLIPPI